MGKLVFELQVWLNIGTDRSCPSQAALEADGAISKEQTIALASTNVEKLLGIVRKEDEVELVATSGGDLLGFGKVIGVISPRRRVFDLFVDRARILEVASTGML